MGKGVEPSSRPRRIHQVPARTASMVRTLTGLANRRASAMLRSRTTALPVRPPCPVVPPSDLVFRGSLYVDIPPAVVPLFCRHFSSAVSECPLSPGDLPISRTVRGYPGKVISVASYPCLSGSKDLYPDSHRHSGRARGVRRVRSAVAVRCCCGHRTRDWHKAGQEGATASGGIPASSSASPS